MVGDGDRRRSGVRVITARRNISKEGTVVIIDVEIDKACVPENVTRAAGCHPTLGHPVPDGARA